MTLADIGIIAQIVSAIAVVATLAYLALQVSHSNRLAQMQTRQHMVQMANDELRIMIDDPEMARRFLKPAPLEFAEAHKLYSFVILALRHREWEWYQAHNGAIGKADAEQVKRDCFQVASLWLRYPRSRKFWETTGRFAFNPQFAAELDVYLDQNPRGGGFVGDTEALEAAMVEYEKEQAGAAKRRRPRAKKCVLSRASR